MPDSITSRRPHAIAFLVLLSINLLCYWPVFQCYFLIDDFFHLTYLESAFHENLLPLFSNLWTIWCQDLSYGAYYRPLVSFFMAIDFLIYRDLAFGYHLTAFLMHVAISLCVYFVAGVFCRLKGGSDSHTARLASAALFSVAPTNGEPVAWIAARVDLLCAIFYFSALYLILRSFESDSKNLYRYGLLLFALALASKEAAASLPFIATAYCFITANKSSIREGLKRAAGKTSAVWLVFIAYLGVRAMVLGEAMGGYKGGIGALLEESFWDRLRHSFALYFYPVPNRAFSSFELCRGLLQAIYGTLATILIFAASRTIYSQSFGKASDSLIRLSLCLFAVFISLLPIMPVIYITENMQGGRLFYIPSAFAAITLVSLIAFTTECFSKSWQRLVRYASALSFAGLFMLSGIACFENCLGYKHSGDEIKRVRSAALARAEQCRKDEHLVMLTMPEDDRYPKLFYNVKQFFGLLRPPLSDIDYSTRFFFMEPDLYTSLKTVNRTTLRRLSEEPGKYTFIAWNGKKGTFETVLPPENNQGIEDQMLFVQKVDNSRSFDYRLMPANTINPAAFDILEIETGRGLGQYGDRALSIYFLQTAKDQRLDPKHSIKRVIETSPGTKHVLLGQRPEWFLSKRLIAFYETTMPLQNMISLKKASLKSSTTLMPVLDTDPETLSLDRHGVFKENSESQPGTLIFDASSIPSARACRIDISIPHAIFQLPSLSYLTDEPGAQVMKTITVEGERGTVQLDDNWFPRPAPYQIRVRALDSSHRELGYYSYPIYFVPR